MKAASLRIKMKTEMVPAVELKHLGHRPHIPFYTPLDMCIARHGHDLAALVKQPTCHRSATYVFLIHWNDLSAQKNLER